MQTQTKKVKKVYFIPVFHSANEEGDFYGVITRRGNFKCSLRTKETFPIRILPFIYNSN